MSPSSPLAERLDGATDRLSPMLLKELRQGMKARGFGLAFLLMQGLMVFNVLIGAASPSNPRSMTFGFSQAFFWMCVATPLLIVMPARALAGVQQEFRANTLELLFLTRLSAWRIVAGKWVALFSQTLLLASGILPFLLLRYFFGGINIADDVQVFLYLLLSSGLLCAAGLCLSSYRNPAVRVLAILGILSLPSFIGMAVSFASMSGHGGGGRSGFAGTPHPAIIFALFLVGTALLVLLLIAWTSDRIAPPARRHTAAKRLLTLALGALAAFLSYYTRSDEWLILAFVILIPICLDALAEPLQGIPSLYAPFARRGFLFRWLNRVLTPGWAPAAVFTMLLIGLLVLMGATNWFQEQKQAAVLLGLFGGLLGPLAFIQVLRPNTRRLPGLYLILQLFLVILACVIYGANAFRPLPLPWFYWIPTTSFLLALLDFSHSGKGLIPLAVMDAVITLALLVPLRGAFARIRAWEAEALDDAPRAG